MARIGIVGDIHEPFCHPMYRRFIQDTFSKCNVNHVHFIGDIVDLHSLSFHERDPNLHSAWDEHKQAQENVKRWVRAFPKATVSIGNHDERHYRVARKAGLSDNYLKAYKEIWSTPGWDWQYEHEFDDTLLTHGTGCAGREAAFNLATQRRMSVAIGHLHSNAGYRFHANSSNRIFGLSVSCGADPTALAFAYGKFLPVRPMLGCGVIDDGHPMYFAMKIGRGERYHRSRAGKRRRKVLV